MLRHRLKTGDLASSNAALIRTLSEAFRDRHKETPIYEYWQQTKTHYWPQNVVTHCTIQVNATGV